MEFGEDGAPNLTLMGNPKAFAGLAPPTAEELKRRDEIIERKRSEFFARRRVRKLE
jgi:hypothetical protein